MNWQGKRWNARAFFIPLRYFLGFEFSVTFPGGDNYFAIDLRISVFRAGIERQGDL